MQQTYHQIEAAKIVKEINFVKKKKKTEFLA